MRQDEVVQRGVTPASLWERPVSVPEGHSTPRRCRNQQVLFVCSPCFHQYNSIPGLSQIHRLASSLDLRALSY